MNVSTRVDRTLHRLATKFASGSPPHEPSPEQWAALRWLVERLQAMATGTAAPVYSLCHLDCGVGKTQAIIAYIQVLLEDHIAGQDLPGMVVFSDRLDDIYTPAEPGQPEAGLLVDLFPTKAAREAAKRAGLFGVYTSDPKRNRLGVDPAATFESPDLAIHDRAPVLFTTQAALLLRCGEYGGFTKVPHFWFRGRPRPCRVWDEHLASAFPLTLDPEMGLRMVRYMRRLDPDLADRFHEDMNELKAWPADTLYQLRDYSTAFGVDPEDLYRCAPNLAEDQATALAVCKLQGQVGIVRRDNLERGTTILSYAENLAADLPPMVVCDANGRFAYQYKAWSDRRGNLERCPIEAPKSYANMTIRHWDTGAGRAIWADAARRRPILDGIVKYLNALPHDEDVLVLHYKAAKGQNRPGHQRVPDIPYLIKRHLVDPDDDRSGVVNPRRLKFTHWPAKATNKFRSIKHVIVAGAFFLPEPVYEAIARAALGMLPADHPDRPEDLAKVIRSVDQGNLFQGILRSAARLSDGPGCRPCDVLVIGSRNRGVDVFMLRGLFPDAPVIGWHPAKGDGATKMFDGQVTRVQQGIEFLKAREGQPGLVPWSALSDLLGNPARTYLHGPRFKKHPDMQAYLNGRWREVAPTRQGMVKGAVAEGGLTWIG
jgi:hypothetical protein